MKIKDLLTNETTSAKETAFDIACEFKNDNLFIFVSKPNLSITDRLEDGYITSKGQVEQLQFQDQFKLRGFLSYLKEYKNLTILNEDAIDSYDWV